MYPREATRSLINLVHCGFLSIDQFEFTSFKLDNINDAIEQASTQAGTFKMTVINSTGCSID
jgi:Zn-dependent alcohol dehydrogenase